MIYDPRLIVSVLCEKKERGRERGGERERERERERGRERILHGGAKI